MTALASTARVTPALVKEIIETALTGDELNPFINVAHYLVQQILLDKGLSADLLTEIEKWLSAHFLAIMDQRVHSESVGGEWQATYQGKTDMGLNATTYGQQALLLDTTGSLANAAAGLKRASLDVFSEYD